jgi:hypothetical protein
VVYTLGDSLLVTSAAAGDGFIKAEELLLKNGLLDRPLLPGYLSVLRDSVLYWDGARATFVRATDLGPRAHRLP